MTQKTLEHIASTPAVILDKGVDLSKLLFGQISGSLRVKKASEYWHTLGPGLTTGAADDDPSGIGTYSQTGAQYGFGLLWLALFTFPLMSIIQEMCARIGLVTGEGLAGNIKHYFPRWVLYSTTVLLFAANTFNIGADLGAMAKATQLLLPHIRFSLLILLFTVLSLGLQIFISYKQYSKYLKWLALILLAYVFSSLSLKVDWSQVLQNTFIPSLDFSRNQIILICAVLGTTISPYLFFWQTSQEIEEEILKGKHTVELRRGSDKEQIKKMRIDVWAGMFLSNMVMFFIIAASGATLFAHGITNITTADQAALALKPLAGNFASLLFALGIIGTGMLAVPVLAGSASYAISESLGWDHGLHRKLKEASAFYGLIIFSMIIGFILNLVGIDPIRSLIYSAVVNGLIAPVILILIVIISSSQKIMGEWRNRSSISAIGWLTTVIMAIAGAATIFSLVLG